MRSVQSRTLGGRPGGFDIFSFQNEIIAELRHYCRIFSLFFGKNYHVIVALVYAHDQDERRENPQGLDAAAAWLLRGSGCIRRFAHREPTHCSVQRSARTVSESSGPATGRVTGNRRADEDGSIVKPLRTFAEFGEQIQRSARTARRIWKDCGGPVHKIGGSTMLLQSDIDAYIAGQRVDREERIAGLKQVVAKAIERARARAKKEKAEGSAHEENRFTDESIKQT